MIRSPARIVLMALLALGARGAAYAGDGALAEEVRRAAARTYYHGITEATAREVVGPDGAPHLLELLRDPAFPRRDNVVALLTHLGGAETTDALLRFLESPPVPASVPEEDRALLLTPTALGHLAARGDAGARQALLEMTDPGGGGDILAAAVARAGGPPSLEDDLRASARRALERLESDVRPSAPDETAGDPVIAATQDLDSNPRVHDSSLTYANHVNVVGKMTDSLLDARLGEASLRAGRDDYEEDVACCVTLSRSGTGRLFGSQGDGLDVVDDSAELQAVLNEPVARVKVVRAINWCGSPAANVIGCAEAPGDGMVLVRLSDPGAEAVLWIHEYGHNTGLGHVSDVRNLLHATDNGSNRGLTQSQCDRYHAPAAAARMTPADVGSCTDADADSVQDVVDNCPDAPNTDQRDSDGDGVGDACIDPDGDGLEGAADNCPLAFNPDQTDTDADGDGDACDADDDNDGVADATDNCPLVRNAPQADADGDGLGNLCDPCTDADRDGHGVVGHVSCPGGSEEDCDDTRATVHPEAPEVCDGLDNDCDLATDEALCEDFDADGDTSVDGVELAWLARAFGECGAPGGVEWWDPVDYNADGCVDGQDLAYLASVWGCSSPGPVCE